MDDLATPREAEAAGLLRHDVVSPLRIAGYVLRATADDPTVTELVRQRLELVMRSIGSAADATERAAAGIAPPDPGPRRPATWRGMVATAWEAVTVDLDTSPTVIVVGGRDDEPCGADGPRVQAVLADLLAFAAHGGAPETVSVTVTPDDVGLQVVVADGGVTPVDRRLHDLGSLCLTRAARIVGADVVVEVVESGASMTVLLGPDLVGVPDEDAGSDARR